MIATAWAPHSAVDTPRRAPSHPRAGANLVALAGQNHRPGTRIPEGGDL